MGVNDAYYSFLASTQQRRSAAEVPLLAITDSKHPIRDEDEEISYNRITARARAKARWAEGSWVVEVGGLVLVGRVL